MQASHRKELLEAIQAETAKQKTPEEAMANLIALGLFNEDGSPSSNYYQLEGKNEIN